MHSTFLIQHALRKWETKGSIAKAKVCWTSGDFAQAKTLCDTLISTYNDFDKTFAASSNLHVPSAMTGKALCGLGGMQSLQDAYSVQDYFCVASKFLERHPENASTATLAAQLNAGLAEAIYNLFVQRIHGGDISDIPMDAALKAWFQGLQKSKGSNMAVQHYLTASFQTNLAWGVLNFE